jgi:hypothetical protein
MMNRDEELERIDALIASFGHQRPNGGWSEQALAAAITRHGWSWSCEGEPGDWRISIIVRDDDSGRCETWSGDADRVVAMLAAFALTLRDHGETIPPSHSRMLHPNT